MTQSNSGHPASCWIVSCLKSQARHHSTTFKVSIALQYLVGGLDHHQVVLGGGQDPPAVIGDIHCGDGAAQARDGCVGPGQRLVAVQAYLTVI